jgi:uncharacterized protein
MQRRFQRVPAVSLPIFSTIRAEHAIFYTPRKVCVLDKDRYPSMLRHIECLAAAPPHEENAYIPHPNATWQAAVQMIRAARMADKEMGDASRQEPTFECLTIYLNNQCNMRCLYCYAQPTPEITETVSEHGVRAAAKLVTGMCAEKNTPFTLAFHGGGEPTLHVQYIDRLLDIVYNAAASFGLCPRTYIATNGAVSEETAHWLASRFDLIGVSCDGPPEIQDRHRPGRNGQPLSGHVDRTIKILRKHGRPFHIRTTITRETAALQAEIVSYLADRFRPNEIRIEPVYINPSGEIPMDVRYAATFVDKFRAAQTAGAARGIPVTTSIMRPGALYGPYCNVLRRVLNLAPGDIATGCFLCSRPEDIRKRGVKIGSLDSDNEVFRIDREHFFSLIDRCTDKPVGCDDCLCSHQCTYGCPDRCILEKYESSPLIENRKENFRCLINRKLLDGFINDVSDRAWNSTPPGLHRELQDPLTKLSVAVYRDR